MEKWKWCLARALQADKTPVGSFNKIMEFNHVIIVHISFNNNWRSMLYIIIKKFDKLTPGHEFSVEKQML